MAIMKKTFILFLLCLTTSGLSAQNAERLSQICLNPYISEDADLAEPCRQLLEDKLSLIATAGGLSGKGVDNRFIITSNVRPTKYAQTKTAPVKTVVNLSVSIYIGDGLNGTLFASANKDVKGVGDTEQEAFMSAIKSIPTRNGLFTQCVEEAKQRILKYYDAVAPSIISSAEATAAAGNYQEAISQLFTIPVQCAYYQKAQQSIADMAAEEIDVENRRLLALAQSAWGNSPDSYGASEANRYLNGIRFPSKAICAAIAQLSDAMDKRLSHIANQQWQKQMKEMTQRHQEELARIESDKEKSIAFVNAAASVARTYLANRPKVVYRVYHWW